MVYIKSFVSLLNPCGNVFFQVLAGVQAKEDNLTNVLENVIEKVLLIIFNVSKSQTSGL